MELDTGQERQRTVTRTLLNMIWSRKINKWSRNKFSMLNKIFELQIYPRLVRVAHPSKFNLKTSDFEESK